MAAAYNATCRLYRSSPRRPISMSVFRSTTVQRPSFSNARSTTPSTIMPSGAVYVTGTSRRHLAGRRGLSCLDEQGMRQRAGDDLRRGSSLVGRCGQEPCLDDRHLANLVVNGLERHGAEHRMDERPEPCPGGPQAVARAHAVDAHLVAGHVDSHRRLDASPLRRRLHRKTGTGRTFEGGRAIGFPGAEDVERLVNHRPRRIPRNELFVPHAERRWPLQHQHTGIPPDDVVRGV